MSKKPSLLAHWAATSPRPSVKIPLPEFGDDACCMFVKATHEQIDAARSYAIQTVRALGYPVDTVTSKAPYYDVLEEQYQFALLYQVMRDPRKRLDGPDPHPEHFARSVDELKQLLDATVVNRLIVAYMDWVDDLAPDDLGEFDIRPILDAAKKPSAEATLRTFEPNMLRRSLIILVKALSSAQIEKLSNSWPSPESSIAHPQL